MKTNHIKVALQRGEAVFGAWLGLPSPFSARLIARQGFDWLVIDTEHAPIDITLTVQMVGAIADAGGVPIVRVASNTVENIKRALDSGAWGVVVPMVNTKEEAEAVVRACKYPPEGERSIGGAFAGLSFNANRADYYTQSNREILVIIQLESKQAVDNCEEILSVPGIDVAFVGPNDLHASLGLLPRSESAEPVFNAALEQIKAVARSKNVPLGIFSTNGEAAASRAQEGFQFISTTTDIQSLEQGLARNLNSARKL